MPRSPTRPALALAAALLLAPALAPAPAVGACSAAPGPPASADPPDHALFQQYAVAADHPLASQAGASILAAGGNAVDAAVATSFALSVVRPFSCGIGGGGFMVIYSEPTADPARPARAVAINYRETAPACAVPDYFQKLDDPLASTRGGKACAVPGTVAGLLHALDRYGTLDRARVLAPAIRLANDGFPADTAYAAAAHALIAEFDKHPDWKARFAFTWERFLGGGKVEVGDAIRLPEQARVLGAIAERGRDGFYTGQVARDIIDADRAAGGGLTLDDLAGYTVAEADPLRAAFAGRRLITMPPPSSGGLALAQIFGLLERKDIADQADHHAWAAYTQLIVESFKHAFADRAAWLADPAFSPVPAQRLLSGPYLDRLASFIEIGRTNPPELYGSRPGDPTIDPPPPPPPVPSPPDDGGTSHFSIIDLRTDGGRAPMAVACTETINLHFGSLVSGERLGFCLNDEMDDFTTRWAPDAEPANAFHLVQSPRNRPQPGKRPLSSMSPTIVLDADGRIRAVAGGSGGPRIITATAQVLLDALVRHDDAAQAVARKRFHHQWKPNTLEFEPGFDDRQSGLGVDMWMRKLHHHVVTATPDQAACVQLILRDQSSLDAACDPRKGGAPAGR